jgi:hypothetical protein
MDEARVVEVNGRNVVKVSGTFMDQSGKPTTYHTGIFAEANASGTDAISVGLESLDERQFSALQGTFAAMFKSVAWQR